MNVTMKLPRWAKNLSDFDKQNLTPEFIKTIGIQRKIFIENKENLIKKYSGMTVGVAGGKIFVGDSETEVIEQIETTHTPFPFYIEDIP